MENELIEETIEDLDELNSNIGLLIRFYAKEHINPDYYKPEEPVYFDDTIRKFNILRWIQCKLIDIKLNLNNGITEKDIKKLENQITIMDDSEELTKHILPGGFGLAQSQSYICSDKSKRINRKIKKINKKENEYLKLLIKYFFVFARDCSSYEIYREDNNDNNENIPIIITF